MIIFKSLLIILISLILFFFLGVGNEKVVYALNANIENQNAIVDWQLDPDDQLSVIEIALFDKNGHLLPSNHFEEQCDTVSNCHLELKKKLEKRNIQFIAPNKIKILPELLNNYVIWVGIKTLKYNRYPSHILFCSQGDVLIREKDGYSENIEGFYEKCKNL
jgi:hypothetical protein